MNNKFKPRPTAKPRKHNSKPYSPFPTSGEFYLRDASGTCAKAVFQNNSFAWIEIDPEDFQAANSDREAA